MPSSELSLHGSHVTPRQLIATLRTVITACIVSLVLSLVVSLADVSKLQVWFGLIHFSSVSAR